MGKRKVIAFVQARMGSNRLPGKVLKEIEGSPLLGILINRLKFCSLLNNIVIITSGSPKDDIIVDFCKKEGIEYFRGPEDDVLGRYYWAAYEYKADIVVRITADCPLIDPRIVDKMVGTFLSKKCDFLSNMEPLPNTYPDGMDVSVLDFKALEKGWKEANRPSEREHVIFYFYKNPDKFKILKMECEQDYSDYRFTVDYPEDYELIKMLMLKLKEKEKFGHLEDLIEIMEENPELKQINSGHRIGEGWQLSFAKDEQIEKIQAKKAEPLNCIKSDELWMEVIKVIPGGAQTFSKMPYQHVEGVAPKFLIRGKGCRVWDLDGNEFIDSILGLGAILFGHCNKEINNFAFEIAKDYFTTPSLPHPLEYELATRLIELIPCAEMVRYAKNGTDVTSAAVRLARYVTKRDVIACTGYHGWKFFSIMI